MHLNWYRASIRQESGNGAPNDKAGQARADASLKRGGSCNNPRIVTKTATRPEQEDTVARTKRTRWPEIDGYKGVLQTLQIAGRFQYIANPYPTLCARSQV
jgi:hypothetical protein